MSTENELPTTDEFSAAFADASSDVPATEAPPAAPAVDPAPAAETDDAPAAETDDAPAAETDDAPAAETGDAPAPTPAPVEDPRGALDPRYLAQAIAEAQAIADSERAAAAAPKPPAAKPASEMTIDDFLSDAERETLKSFASEWDEVAPALNIHVNAAVKLALAQARAEWGSQLAPISQQMQRSQVTSHTASIYAAHPDVDSIRDGLAAWVAKQSPITRPAFEAVLAKGSAAQVIEVLNMYKEANKATGAAPATPASSAAPATPAVVQPSAATNAAAAATAAVVLGKRSTTVTPPAAEDFDAAWKEAANA